MRLSLSLIFTLFFLLLGVVCAWAVYTAAFTQPDRAQASNGDSYPTSIAVLDKLHRETFLALQRNGLQDVAWIETVEWAPLGGQVTIAAATGDAALAGRIRAAVSAHPGIEEVTVRPVTDLQQQAAAAIQKANLEKYAFIEAMKGRVPVVRLADGNQNAANAVRRTLAGVPGVLASRTETASVGDLVARAARAIEAARLQRYAIVDRADGRVLYLRLAGDDKERETKALAAVRSVPGVLRVDVTKVPLAGEAKVESPGGCQVLFSALKGRWRIVFTRGTARIEKESHPLLERLTVAARRCSAFTLVVTGPGISRRESRAVRRLSGNRANAVVDYFVSQGLPRKMFRARAYAQPEDEANPENRHIEFIVRDASKASGGAK